MEEKQSFGRMVAELRRKKGLTQLELAEQMNVTDKAVSKWERDLSFPDVSSLPRLAEIFEVSVDELMQGKAPAREVPEKKEDGLIPLILRSVALAMGIAVTVLSILHQADAESAVPMLGIGLACLAMTQFPKKQG